MSAARDSYDDIAVRWYRPVAVTFLRRWLPCAGIVNLLVLGGEWIREDLVATMLASSGVAALVTLSALVIGSEALPARSRRICWLAAVFVSVSALAIGLLSLVRSSFSFYDLFSRAWLIGPGVLTLFWLLSQEVRVWFAGQVDGETAAVGLARHRRLAPRLESFGTHLLLWHAAALVVVPVVWIVDVAVSPGNALGGAIGDAFTMEHFERLIVGESFWLWTRNSLTVATGTTMLGLAFAIPAGYAFSRFKFSGRSQAMFAVLLVQMFPGVIILVPYFMVMKTLGLLNTSIGLILAYSVTALPLCVWMLKGFFDTVPRELEEAALLDGCTQVQVFRRIVLPLSLPAVAVTALFSFLAAWNEFLLALVFNTSNEQYTLPVGLASMIPANGQRWGDFAAASILVSVPVVILFVLFQKPLVQGLSFGGVKG
ncbi:MAG: sugar ABC transporter permease [Gammaproteobacteria bacterium]|nr:sugar ABC transporter permease [Gammaproteobacteria bacterium]MYF31211.1 sugar ABC transporter permease [Gammaproteobacteria bacterium]MYK45154.1 sugar ABC transporter permease [Gammaproteobacteria bacterium]